MPTNLPAAAATFTTGGKQTPSERALPEPQRHRTAALSLGSSMSAYHQAGFSSASAGIQSRHQHVISAAGGLGLGSASRCAPMTSQFLRLRLPFARRILPLHALPQTTVSPQATWAYRTRSNNGGVSPTHHLFCNVAGSEGDHGRPSRFGCTSLGNVGFRNQRTFVAKPALRRFRWRLLLPQTGTRRGRSRG